MDKDHAPIFIPDTGLADTLSFFSSRTDIRLTDSAISKQKLGQKAWMFPNIRIVAGDFDPSDLKALWHRPSLLSGIEPDLTKAVALGKAIGVDLVMMHKMVKKSGRDDITIFLIDVSRNDVYKKNILTITSSALKDGTKALIEKFLAKHPLPEVENG